MAQRRQTDMSKPGDICEFCGAYSTRSCELREEMNGICPWEESEPDPDILREDRDERQRLAREDGDHE